MRIILLGFTRALVIKVQENYVSLELPVPPFKCKEPAYSGKDPEGNRPKSWRKSMP